MSTSNEVLRLYSAEEWKKVSMEVLRLKCNEFALRAGKKDFMIKKLMKHFAQCDSASFPNTQQADVVSFSVEQTMHNLSQPAQLAVNNSSQLLPIAVNNLVATQSIPSPSLTSTEPTNEISMVLHELRKLQAEVATIKLAQQGSSRQTENNNNGSAETAEPRGSRVDNNTEMEMAEPARGFDLPHFLVPTTGNQGNNSFSNNTPSKPNPYRPPVLKMKVLRAIEKREFVDFEELVPKYGDNNYGLQNELGVGFDSDNSTLLVKQNRKATINNASSWFAAWNTFLQASLQYHPEMAYELFCYQKYIIRQTTKYKFEACYAYDNSFRLIVASEASVHPDQRSAKWTSIEDETANSHFTQDALLPVCYLCKAVGHYAKICPSAKEAQGSNNIDNQFRNGAHSATIQHATFNTANTEPQQMLPSRFKPTGQQSGNRGSCIRFNRGIYCLKSPCQFEHKCNICNQGHPGIKCAKVTSTNFMPQHQ